MKEAFFIDADELMHAIISYPDPVFKATIRSIIENQGHADVTESISVYDKYSLLKKLEEHSDA